MAVRKRRGFTIVELLVVISIIAMLMALLVPAVSRVRDRARQTQCTNNMRQISQALLAYQATKGYFPGRMNPMKNVAGYDIQSSGQLGVNWLVKILPNIDRADVDELVRNEELKLVANQVGVDLPIVVCPADPPLAANAPKLSFVVNAGIPDDHPGHDLRANGIFHDLRGLDPDAPPVAQLRVSLDYWSKNDGAGTTILLSENLDAGSWFSPLEWEHGLTWIEGNKRLGVNEDPIDNSYEPFHRARPSSNHAQSVNVAFCDGKVQTLSQEIEYWVYAQLMTPDGRNCVPDFHNQGQRPAWATQPITTALLNP